MRTCAVCVQPHPEDTKTCPTCGYYRRYSSVRAVLFWWTLALLLYIPSLMLPVMRTVQFGFSESRTITRGINDLWQGGHSIAAIIVFIASIIIPITKLVILAVLIWRIKANTQPSRAKTAQLAYSFVDWIGRWSMIDVFVIAVLGALIQLGSISNVRPGFAILLFGLAVIATMIATRCVDERWFWQPRTAPAQSPKHEVKPR